MLHASGLIPTRFLVLIAHFVVTTSILISRNENVKACLPFEYKQEEYARKDIELATGLGISIGLMGIELFGFLMGISMFSPGVTLLSIGSHASAVVAMTYFCLDVWDCNLYWWIFGFGSCLPALTEVFLMIGLLGLRKTF
ncbi:TMEM107 [Lepeophtheirus salmonis]|uniref:Transmembrane protein 107 n=2 Tax=Lepeophtheirus salmonis TaxID=72036 RepID=A0A0K2UXV3_LEPSM|nr:transmembrane protein 107-like [Lepeophtheirus salmonis]CAB4055576.1 TMEM107 [Lepeophtheirus salmonis]CAF2777417.1 TMEM107 [Lepeophtheirus salmonis]